jgi:hypothetical protein
VFNKLSGDGDRYGFRGRPVVVVFDAQESGKDSEGGMPARIEGILPSPNKNCPSEFKLATLCIKPRGRQEKNGWIYGPAACGRPEGLYGSW